MYKNRLIFIMKWTKRQKKNKNKLTFSSHLLPFVGYDESNAVPHCLFPGGLTDVTDVDDLTTSTSLPANPSVSFVL